MVLKECSVILLFIVEMLNAMDEIVPADLSTTVCAAVSEGKNVLSCLLI